MIPFGAEDRLYPFPPDPSLHENVYKDMVDLWTELLQYRAMAATR